MNVQETNEIRELTAEEVNEVTGGLLWGWVMGPLYAGAGLLGGVALMDLALGTKAY